MARKQDNQRGFSLVELMTVLVVVGILLAITAPALHGYLDSYRVRDAATAISGELRMARQKAVTNGTRNWYYGWTASQYLTGVQTWNGSSWSSIAWTINNMPPNTKMVSANFTGGLTYVYFGVEGRPHNVVNAYYASPPSNASGTVRITSTNPANHDTSDVNLELAGAVWQ